MFQVVEWAGECNAQRLLEFCQWWVTVNYEECSAHKAFNSLPKEMKEKAEEERWPPLSYLERKKMLEKERKKRQKKDNDKNCGLQ